ncbi:MAG: hypothetical protein EA348_10525, partial [Pseudomonadaceae bacterium]
MPEFTLSTLSSSPDQVSGGDLLLSIQGDLDLIDTEMDNLELWLNDQVIEPARLRTRNGQLEVLIDGLELGDNQLKDVFVRF